MKYFNNTETEITQEQYDVLVVSGKDFEIWNPVVDANAEAIKPNSGRIQGLKQLEDSEQSTKNGNDAQWIIDNPWATQLSPAKTNKLQVLSRKARGRFEKYVDKHYAKTARRGSDTTPQAVKDYASALDTAWDTIKDEVNALTTIDEVNEYKINQVVWPDDSTVKGL